MEFPHVVIARLYEHIEPIDRGNRYEDPLQEVYANLDFDAVVSEIAAAGPDSYHGFRQGNEETGLFFSVRTRTRPSLASNRFFTGSRSHRMPESSFVMASRH